MLTFLQRHVGKICEHVTQSDATDISLSTNKGRAVIGYVPFTRLQKLALARSLYKMQRLN